VAGYRDVLRGWRQLGCAFDEAMAALDLAMLLAPTDQEMPEAAGIMVAAQQTLARLGALPLLARLASMTRTPWTTSGSGDTATPRPETAEPTPAST